MQITRLWKSFGASFTACQRSGKETQRWGSARTYGHSVWEANRHMVEYTSIHTQFLQSEPDMICWYVFSNLWNYVRCRSWTSTTNRPELSQHDITWCKTRCAPPKFNSSPLKNGGTGRRSFLIGFWSLLRGELLNFGGIFIPHFSSFRRLRRRKLLLFCTGCDRVPILGLKAL